MKYEEMNKAELLMEIDHLKRRLSDYETRFGPLEEEDDSTYLTLAMSKEEKLSVFLDYFAGRQDVIAERYISKTDGKKRYSLGCLNKFNRLAGCDIERTHCKDCPLFVPKPYDEKAVLGHINDERKMIGIYPILPGNYVSFLVFDLDEESYLNDATRLRSTLFSLSVDSVMERSQSGHGIHIWVFFEEKIKAADARKIANYVLTESMDRYGGFDFKSYDRVFPNQDKVEKGGYGNCVALPLNKQCVEQGNTAFLKPDFQVIRKPFEYLSTVRKVSKGKAKELLEFAAQKEEYGLFGERALNQMSLSADDFVGTLHMHVSGDLHLPLVELSPRAKRFLLRASSILNKEYFKLLNARKSVYNIPKILSCAKEDNRYFRLPRGFKEPLVRLFKSKGIPYELSSSLCKGIPIDVSLKLSLRPKQVELLERALEIDAAIICAPTGFGKTVLGEGIVARKKVSTLILVPSITLLKQWYEHLKENMELANGTIGYLSGAGDKLGGVIDVATIQSLVRNESFRKKAKENYGLVLVDEVHHMAAVKFEEAIRELCPKYLYGLTATPERADELEEFIFRSFGPLVKLEDEGHAKGFIKHYHPRFTKYCSRFDGSDIQSLFAEVTHDEERNRLILEDVKEAYQKGGRALLLTERIDHARILFEGLRVDVENLAILYGGQDRNERKKNQDLLGAFGDSPFVVVSIGKYIGEGFDDDRFNTLFITYPFRWKGILAQYCGRLQRKDTPVKQIDVYDYVDPLVPAFSKMYRAREKGYYDLGYKLVNLNPSYSSDILGYDEYEKRLNQDLAAAKKEALFFVSYAHENRLQRLLDTLSCSASVLVTGGLDLGDIAPSLRTEKELPNLLILDERILYYGGINPFMFGQKDGTIMRIEDPTIAKQIKNSLLNG